MIIQIQQKKNQRIDSRGKRVTENVRRTPNHDRTSRKDRVALPKAELLIHGGREEREAVAAE